MEKEGLLDEFRHTGDARKAWKEAYIHYGGKVMNHVTECRLIKTG